MNGGRSHRLLIVGANSAAYDRPSSVGQLDFVWDKAGQEGWIVDSMKEDWNRVFPFAPGA